MPSRLRCWRDDSVGEVGRGELSSPSSITSVSSGSSSSCRGSPGGLPSTVRATYEPAAKKMTREESVKLWSPNSWCHRLCHQLSVRNMCNLEPPTTSSLYMSDFLFNLGSLRQNLSLKYSTHYFLSHLSLSFRLLQKHGAMEGAHNNVYVHILLPSSLKPTLRTLHTS